MLPHFWIRWCAGKWFICYGLHSQLTNTTNVTLWSEVLQHAPLSSYKGISVKTSHQPSNGVLRLTWTPTFLYWQEMIQLGECMTLERHCQLSFNVVFPCNSFCLAGCSQPVLAGSSPSISSVHCGRGMHIKSTLKHQFEQVFFVRLLFCVFFVTFAARLVLNMDLGHSFYEGFFFLPCNNFFRANGSRRNKTDHCFSLYVELATVVYLDIHRTQEKHQGHVSGHLMNISHLREMSVSLCSKWCIMFTS